MLLLASFNPAIVYDENERPEGFGGVNQKIRSILGFRIKIVKYHRGLLCVFLLGRVADEIFAFHPP